MAGLAPLDIYWITFLITVVLIGIILHIFRKPIDRWSGNKDSGARRRNRRR